MLLAAAFYNPRLRNTKHYVAPTNNVQATTSQDVKSSRASRNTSKPTQYYRELFFKLQNLEEHSDVLESARDELLAMLSRGISLGLKQPQKGIFGIEHYDAEKVGSFIEAEQEEVLEKWGRYIKRRDQGHAPELFATVEAAKAWLVQQAPIKFVDGAWLAHSHKITTPFALRSVTKNAWQVLSEELGDGDLSKHHVYLYSQLLKEVGSQLPEGHSAAFVEPCHWNGMENHDVWEAGVGQLLISLFPNEFLPEILGFNMHYELITLDTLRANHELKALGINPYYFLIHIVIDNADSGHTAMATHTVTRYLDMIREREGEAAMEQAWKRVQAGYALSQTLGSSPSLEQEAYLSSGTGKESIAAERLSLDPFSTRVVNIFKAKASVSHRFHCQSRVRIGGKTLADWLAPSMWKDSNPERQLHLLTALSQAKPWIYPGSSSKSLLMRELAWEGRMFGAFTHDEVAALGAWIDTIGPDGKALRYWNFTCREPLASKDAVGALQDPIRHHPVVMPRDAHVNGTDSWGSFDSVDSELQIAPQPLTSPSRARLPDVVALWFTHIGLLENTINTPSRTANPVYAKIICLLRAQAGFAVETPIVAGMDELRRLSCPSLVDIGHELISRAAWASDAKVTCLHDVLLLTASHGQDERSMRLAHDMLGWATRPTANLGLLLGLAWAFLELKEAVARAPELLAQETRGVLEAIVARERRSLEGCAQELRTAGEELQYQGLIRGYHLGRRALQDLCIEAASG